MASDSGDSDGEFDPMFGDEGSLGSDLEYTEEDKNPPPLSMQMIALPPNVSKTIQNLGEIVVVNL